MTAPTGITPGFWAGRRVLLTGHTGFKGGWAALWLDRMGARVHGFALPPEDGASLWALAGIGAVTAGGFGDLRDADAVGAAVAAADPQIVLHMAAQPLVRRSFRTPVETFGANVMGTVHLLDALRAAPSLQAVVVVTTDKVYENPETGRAFVENDPLGGHDPYAASKAAAEIVASSYARSFFAARGVPVVTARGGNVIGGGDFSEDRIVPDIWRSLVADRPLTLRYPEATRPWQHVLDCLAGYLSFAEAIATRPGLPHALNFGPRPEAVVSVAGLVEAMQRALGVPVGWQIDDGPKPTEMRALALDSGAARTALGWDDRLVGAQAIAATAAWYVAMKGGADMRAHTLASIEAYMAL